MSDIAVAITFFGSMFGAAMLWTAQMLVPALRPGFKAPVALDVAVVILIGVALTCLAGLIILASTS